MRRGPTYRVADFVATAIPKRGSGSFSLLFAHRVVEFLKDLDDLQESNAHLTFTVHSGDALHLQYKGLPLFWILSGQKHMRIGFHTEWRDPVQKSLLEIILSGQGGLFSNKLKQSGVWRQWRLFEQELDALTDFLRKLPADSAEGRILDPSHPRNFPSEARQAALTAFERGGRYCPGLPDRKRHKLKINDRIEYDHILPFSRGGATSVGNVQVLCCMCNNRKRARAL